MKRRPAAPRVEGVAIIGKLGPRFTEVLTPGALRFLADLHREFEAARERLLAARAEQQARYDAGELPDFRPGTRVIRDDPDWRVAPIPEDLQDRRVEITGPVDRKMVINALNSGANVFMADFEDANSPTWANNVEGQINLKDRWAGKIGFTDPDTRKTYRLGDKPAVLIVRPRGWHLVEEHLTVNGEPVSGALFDFGLSFFHNAKAQIAAGTGPYFYLPKLETHRRGAAVERGVRVRAGAARHSERHDPRDGADRDAAGRLRDGGNSRTSCAITSRGSTPGAGTTSSRSSRSSPGTRTISCPTAAKS